MFRSIAAGSKLAVQRRYNLNLFLSVLTGSFRALQSDRFHGDDAGANPAGGRQFNTLRENCLLSV